MYYQPEINFSPDEVLVYLRKSRSDDPQLTVEEVLSKHESMLDEWSVNHLGAVVPESNKFREIVSGETIDDRPEIQKVLKLIESPRYKAVLIVEVQRLSRGDLEDAGRLIKLFRYTNTLVITPPKTYDIRDEYDRDMFERELKRGNEFLEYQKKILNNGRLLSVKQGNYIGSVAPYGYDRAFVMDGKRKCPTLKINPDEAEAVRLIYDLYINENMGRWKIAKELDERGYKPRNTEKWSPHAVIDILNNITYTGKVKWNWRKTVTVIEDGEAVKTRPKNSIDDYLIFDGKHEAIITPEQFEQAQTMNRRSYRARPDTKIRNPLAGIVFCQCGRAMSLRTYKKNGIERSAPRMLCDNQSRCGTSSCLYSELEAKVCEILQSCINDFEIQMKNSGTDKAKRHADLIEKLEQREIELNKKELSQWEKYTEEGMPKHIFDKLNEKTLQEKAEVREALYKARESMPEPIDYERRLSRFRDALKAMKSKDTSIERKNKLLKSCIESITYRREKAVRKTVGMVGGKGKLKTGANWTTSPIELEVTLRL